MREEGRDVGQHKGRLVDDGKHGEAVVERKGRRRDGQYVDCSKVVEPLHPWGGGCGESLETAGRSAGCGIETGANHVSKVMQGRGAAAAAAVVAKRAGRVRKTRRLPDSNQKSRVTKHSMVTCHAT